MKLRHALIATAVLALASCGGGPVKRVSEPAAGIQQLSVRADGRWDVVVRLDNFSSVSEAVAVLRTEPFTVVTANVPGESRLATLHLSMSDASGDSAIIEFIDGKQVIHHDGIIHLFQPQAKATGPAIAGDGVALDG